MVSIYVCTQSILTSMHACIWCMWKCVYVSENLSLTYGVFLNHSIPHVLSKGLPLNLELLGSDYVISNMLWFLLATSHMKFQDSYTALLVLHVFWGIWTWIFMLSYQEFIHWNSTFLPLFHLSYCTLLCVSYESNSYTTLKLKQIMLFCLKL